MLKSKFQLTVLVDNNTIIDKYFLGEPALSFYIEYENKKILFDTGYSDIVLKNAKKMNIPFKQLDYIVLSHGHNDHTGGLKYLLDFYKHLEYKPKIVACSNIFSKRFDNIDGEFGSPLSKEEVESVFKVIYTDKTFLLTENIYFLGKIPRINNYEGKAQIGFLKNSNIPDFVEDDSALAIRINKKIFVVTGCSHSGIINICNYAKQVCKLDTIYSIIGGLHLKEATQEHLEYTINELNRLNLDSLYASHCTGFKATCKLAETIKVKEVGVGLQIAI